MKSNPVRNTTKSFNIEGLTVYFDEFVVRDDYNLSDGLDGLMRGSSSRTTTTTTTTTNHETTMSSSSETSLNSTIDLKDSNNSSSSMLETSSTSSPGGQAAATTTATPVDESPPFNFDLNPDYYLYTNPVIMLTFSGCQSIKLTVNNMKPTDLMMSAGNPNDAAANMFVGGIKDQQRPFLEVNAQFGAIKSLLCPKQIHLLTDMATKLTDYVEAANAYKKALKIAQQRQRYLRRTGRSFNIKIMLIYVNLY